jgi:hypothetical protein
MINIFDRRKVSQVIGIDRITEQDSSVNTLSAALRWFLLETLPIRVLISTDDYVFSERK